MRRPSSNWSAPFVPGVTALQLAFDRRIVFNPEASKILCDLDWPVIWRQDVENRLHAPHGQRWNLLQTIEFLNPDGDKGRGIGRINNLWPLAVGQFQPLWRMLIYH